MRHPGTRSILFRATVQQAGSRFFNPVAAFPKLSTATVGSCVTSRCKRPASALEPTGSEIRITAVQYYLYIIVPSQDRPPCRSDSGEAQVAQVDIWPLHKTDSAMRGLAVVAFRFRCSGADPRTFPSRQQSCQITVR